jgi:hypothetical protein
VGWGSVVALGDGWNEFAAQRHAHAQIAFDDGGSHGADVGEGFGADLRAPVYKAPIGAAPSWAGFYIGGQVGGASVSTSFKDFDDEFDNQGLNGDRRLTWTAGVYGGINFQHDSFVYGIEAAWSWLDGKVTSFPFGEDDPDFLRNKLTDYGSVKARAG